MTICSDSGPETGVAKAEIVIKRVLGSHQVQQHGTRHISPAAGLIKVHIDPLQLEVGVASVCAGGIHPVLIADHLQDHDIKNVSTQQVEQETGFQV